MKKWKVGDKVKFLNEKGGGIITAIKNTEEVIVQLPDGMEILYLSKELIPDDKNIIITSGVSAIQEPNSVDNKILFLAIESNAPNVKNASEYYLYLYNLSDYHCYYTYSAGKQNTFQCLAKGNIQAYEKQKIKTISSMILKDLDLHQFQIIYYQDELYYPQSPTYTTIKLNERTFTPQHFLQHPDFDKPVHIFILKDNFTIDADISKTNTPSSFKIHISEQDYKKISDLKEKIHYNPKHKKNAQKYKEHIILDLHIEELVETPANYTPHQKLQIQLDYFERELYNAIANHVKQITIIHGVGNGRLKYEIREYLKTVDEVKSVEDAPYKEYGWGATMAYLK